MAIEESILRSTKKKLNIAPDDPSFDVDIIDHINSAFTHLHQLGIGPIAGFQIEGEEEKWADFLPTAGVPLINAVKTNVFLQVRGIFDPPTLAHVQKALEQQLSESYFRLSVMREEVEWADPDPGEMVVDGGDPTGEVV